MGDLERLGAQAYHQQLFPVPPPDSFGRWKRITTGWNVAMRLWDTRQAAVRDRNSIEGEKQHRLIALWLSYSWHIGCCDCSWLGATFDSRDELHQGPPVLVSRELAPLHGQHARPMDYAVHPWPDPLEDASRVLLTDVDLDGERLLVLPRELVIATLRTWTTLKYAETFGEAREDDVAGAMVDVHLPVWRESLVSLGLEDSDGADDDPFDAEPFFGDDTNVWVPLARVLTHEFLEASEPDLAARYCQPDTSSGFDYQPAPWVHVDHREALEADLTGRAYQVRQWRGLAEMYLDPPLDAADELGI